MCAMQLGDGNHMLYVITKLLTGVGIVRIHDARALQRQLTCTANLDQLAGLGEVVMLS
jgi:hypothetical protein